jgi:hypothetical protein
LRRAYKITARRTQIGEDKIAVVINLTTRVQQAFFDELSETIFNLIGGITRELDGLERQGSSLTWVRTLGNQYLGPV